MENLNDAKWWDDYFAEGGGWEQNGGRAQTRIFAEACCNQVSFPTDDCFSVLDVGCALGDALKVIGLKYPNAQLTGMDLSAMAVSRCRKDESLKASFFQGTIDDVMEEYDVIYVSNVLEHFSDYREKAAKLMGRCRRLIVMVPYRELFRGKELTKTEGSHHQCTFYRHSLNFLLDSGAASSIDTHVMSCPGAWGWTKSKKIQTMIKKFPKLLLGRPIGEPLQIIFDIRK